MSVYQYVGRTLSDQLGGGGASAIQDIFKPTGSFYATTNDIQISGSLDLTGDFTVHGTVTSSLSETVIVNDNGTMVQVAMTDVKTYVGSASGAFSLANLDIDGATDIGADIVDADLLIIEVFKILILPIYGINGL